MGGVGEKMEKREWKERGNGRKIPLVQGQMRIVHN